MKPVLGRFLCILLPAVLAACSETTSITSAQKDVAVRVREKNYASLPATDKISTTSFGNYEFKAEHAGAEPFYGVLPLNFNGGYLAADILFFAPAMFFNLRGVFPEYEIDTDHQVIRYKKAKATQWTEYKPTQAEADRAKTYFGQAK